MMNKRYHLARVGDLVRKEGTVTACCQVQLQDVEAKSHEEFQTLISPRKVWEVMDSMICPGCSQYIADELKAYRSPPTFYVTGTPVPDSLAETASVSRNWKLHFWLSSLLHLCCRRSRPKYAA